MIGKVETLLDDVVDIYAPIGSRYASGEGHRADRFWTGG
jgi:hypothetical protein